MKNFSAQPDEHMKWIYDHSNPEYHSDHAKDLRAQREAALRACPEWMIKAAMLNDMLRNLKKPVGSRST